jgi:hypothetical protein
MSGFMMRRLVFERLSIISLGAMLLVRTWQLISFGPDSVAGDAAKTAADFYYSLTSIALGVFVLTPLFLVYILSAVRVFNKTSFCSRLKNRESAVYHFALFALMKSLFYSAVTNVSAVIILLAKCFDDVNTVAIIKMATIAIILETLYFLVCALLLFLVFSASKKIHYAAVAVLCYAIWDYVASNIPYYADSLPRFGWQLTQVGVPLTIQEAAQNMLLLIVISALVTFAALVVVRKTDILEARSAESDA